MLSTEVDPVSKERLIIQKGRVLSCSLKYNGETDCYSFRFSNHRSVDWKRKVGKEYASGKIIPEERVRWLSDPQRKMPSYSSFDPCSLLFNSRGEVVMVRKGRLKYDGLGLGTSLRGVPRTYLVKELLSQTTFNEKYVKSMMRSCKVPMIITSLKQVEKISKPNLLSCVQNLLRGHFHSDIYFQLSPVIPPLRMRRWSEEKLKGVEAMIKASPCTLSFAHSVAASLMESILQGYEQLEEESNPLRREAMEKEIKLQEEVAKVLHSIPEVRGATALGNVAKAMKTGSELEMSEFLAADAYPSFSIPLEEFGDDCVVVETEEEKLVSSLEEMGIVTALGENQYSFTRTGKLNQRLANLVDDFIQQLPRTTPTEELIQSNVIRPEKRRKLLPDPPSVPNPVDDLREAAHKGGLILVRVEGIEWLREYTELFQSWRYPAGDEFENGLSSHQQVLFVVPSYEDQIVFYQHTGIDSMIAERPELGAEAHVDHLKDVLSTVRRYPGAVRHVVLLQAQQFDVLTLLETLQMAHDVFCNLQSIILMGDDMLHPSPPRARPLDTVHGLIPPCGQSFGFPFRDLLQKSQEMGMCLLRQRYRNEPPYNCVGWTGFADLQMGLAEMRRGIGIPGLQLQSITQWTSDPLCVSELLSTLQRWREARETCIGSEPVSEFGQGVVMLLSTPNSWSREECWAAADLISSEIRRLHKRNPAVNTTRYCGERVYLEETGTLEIIESAYRYSYGRAFSLATHCVIGIETQQGGGASREQALIQLYNDPIPDHSLCELCSSKVKKENGSLFPAFDSHPLHCGIVIPARFWRPTPTDLVVLLPVTAACGLGQALESSTLTDLRTALSYATKRCLLLEHAEQALKVAGTLTRHSTLSILLQKIQDKNTEWLD